MTNRAARLSALLLPRMALEGLDAAFAPRRNDPQPFSGAPSSSSTSSNGLDGVALLTERHRPVPSSHGDIFAGTARQTGDGSVRTSSRNA
jgi:hypothetical protein